MEKKDESSITWPSRRLRKSRDKGQDDMENESAREQQNKVPTWRDDHIAACVWLLKGRVVFAVFSWHQSHAIGSIVIV